jgi:hypothetical protein
MNPKLELKKKEPPKKKKNHFPSSPRSPIYKCNCTKEEVIWILIVTDSSPKFHSY